MPARAARLFGLALGLCVVVVACVSCVDLVSQHSTQQGPSASAATLPATTTSVHVIATADSTGPLVSVDTAASSTTSLPRARTSVTAPLSLNALEGMVLQTYEGHFATPLTSRNKAAVDSDVYVNFVYDPTEGEVPAGERSPLKTRVYKVLWLMQLLEFDEPLPWTDVSLWDWFCSSVDEIRFLQGDYSVNFFGGVIYWPLGPNDIVLQTDRFIDQQLPCGLADILILFVHEARHAQKDHTEADGTMDKTIAELGSWGVSYHLCFFLADKANYYLDAARRQFLYGRAADMKEGCTQEP